MSGLWTPSGEHRVPPGDSTQFDATDDSDEMGLDADDLTDEQIAALQSELAEARERLASVPPEVVIVNHAMGLYELAAIHLSAQPARLNESALAIDAFACLVEGLGERLGPDAPTMNEALSNIRLAFVQIKGTTGG